MTFKTFFYCDRCGAEGDKTTKYAEWNILFGYIIPNMTKGHKEAKVDLCKACHDKAIAYLKEHKT